MSHVGRGYDINQTFIIEPMASSGGTSPVVSACTAVYTNVVESCSGNTQILLGNGQITFDGNLYTNDNLSASTINASTYFSGGTNLFDIISLNNITGGTFNNNTDTLTLFKQNNSTVVVTGFTDYYTTGATLIGNTVYFNRNDSLSAYTLSLSALSTTDIYTTGVTFNNNQLVITRNDGVSVNTFINNFTGLTINGLLTANSISANSISATTISATTYLNLPNNSFTGGTVNGLTATTISATTYLGLPIDIRVTGGTYSNGVAIFTNNTGGTFNVSGFDSSFTGGTVDGLTATTISATTYLGLPIDVRVTGGTYSNGVAIFTNNTGGTFNVSGFDSSFTGGTVDGLTATTISATTYLGLPIDVRVTGGTYSNGVATFTNNTGGTFNVSGFVSNFTGGTVDGLTATTISATTISATTISATTISATTFYGDGSNLTGISTQDTFVTGATYNNNTFTFRNNTGGTFTTSFNTVSGLTINGNIVVSGSSSLNGQISSANLSGSTDRLVQVNSGGTFSATQQIISAYIPSGSTAATLLENDSNWDINGFYIGTAITDTFQGQKHYDINYFYEAIQDNVFIRLIRG